MKKFLKFVAATLTRHRKRSAEGIQATQAKLQTIAGAVAFMKFDQDESRFEDRAFC